MNFIMDVFNEFLIWQTEKQMLLTNVFNILDIARGMQSAGFNDYKS